MYCFYTIILNVRILPNFKSNVWCKVIFGKCSGTWVSRGSVYGVYVIMNAVYLVTFP